MLSGAAGRRLGSSETDYYAGLSTIPFYMSNKKLFSHTYSFQFDTLDVISRELMAYQSFRVTLPTYCKTAGQCSGLLAHT